MFVKKNKVKKKIQKTSWKEMELKWTGRLYNLQYTLYTIHTYSFFEYTYIGMCRKVETKTNKTQENSHHCNSMYAIKRQLPGRYMGKNRGILIHFKLQYYHHLMGISSAVRFFLCLRGVVMVHFNFKLFTKTTISSFIIRKTNRKRDWHKTMYVFSSLS